MPSTVLQKWFSQLCNEWKSVSLSLKLVDPQLIRQLDRARRLRTVSMLCRWHLTKNPSSIYSCSIGHIWEYELCCLGHWAVQVNFFQKYLFLHQLTHNTTKDCLLIYQFSISTYFVHKLFFVLTFRTIYVHNIFIIFCHLSYCGLVDARIGYSEKDLPVVIAAVQKSTYCYL